MQLPLSVRIWLLAPIAVFGACCLLLAFTPPRSPEALAVAAAASLAMLTSAIVAPYAVVSMRDNRKLLHRRNMLWALAGAIPAAALVVIMVVGLINMAYAS